MKRGTIRSRWRDFKKACSIKVPNGDPCFRGYVCPEVPRRKRTLGQCSRKDCPKFEMPTVEVRQDVVCPFCGEGDFDLIGLKIHLKMGHCDAYENMRLS